MPEIIFTFRSAEHKQRFKDAMQNTGKIYGGKYDAEYGPAIYILSADKHMWDQAKGYIDHHSIDFDAMVDGMDLTSGSKILMYTAGKLFNGPGGSLFDDWDVNIADIASGRLDENNYQLVISAIHFRHYGLSVDALK